MPGDVRVNHRGLEIGTAEQILNRTDVTPVFNQMGGEAVPKSVDLNLFRNACGAGRLLYYPLQPLSMDVVPTNQCGFGINRQLFGRKDPKPTPLPARIGIFPCQGIGHVDAFHTGLTVSIIKWTNGLQVLSQIFLKRLGKERLTIFFSLSSPDNKSAALKIQILHPEPHRFVQPQSTRIDQADH